MNDPSDPRFVAARRFEDWRETARRLLEGQIEPQHVHWIDLWQSDRESQSQLFGADSIAAMRFLSVR